MFATAYRTSMPVAERNIGLALIRPRINCSMEGRALQNYLVSCQDWLRSFEGRARSLYERSFVPFSRRLSP
jgi:hypothetical protein